MQQAALVGVSLAYDINPTYYEGFVYLMWTFSGVAISIAGVITLVIDLWWAYRIVRDYQRGYWRENL